MEQLPLAELEAFIVRAKAVTYAGDGEPVAPARRRSHDLEFADGEFLYHDTYFGGADFAGEEVVYWRGAPVWAMNYFGRITDDAAITAEQAGRVLKASLTALYREGRFLGGFEHAHEGYVYRDVSDGPAAWFRGRETISREGREVYELLYNGGLIRD